MQQMHVEETLVRSASIALVVTVIAVALATKIGWIDAGSLDLGTMLDGLVSRLSVFGGTTGR